VKAKVSEYEVDVPHIWSRRPTGRHTYTADIIKSSWISLSMGMLCRPPTLRRVEAWPSTYIMNARGQQIFKAPGPRHIIHSSSGPQNKKLTFKCAEEEQEEVVGLYQFDIKRLWHLIQRCGGGE